VSEAWNRLGPGRDVQALNWEFPLPGRDWPLPHIAARLRDDRDTFEKFVAFLRSTANDVFVILPPLLLTRAQIARLDEALPNRWAECVSTREPVAGMRLQQAFRSVLADREIPCVVAQQLQPKTVGDRLESISTFDANGWQTIEASRFILATGRFLGGGLTMLPAGPRESMLGLPLYTARDHAIRLDEPERYRKDTSWPLAGVAVDAQFRPIGSGGQAVFENVHATGSLIGGVDGASHDLGIGVHLFLGRHCALVAE
jgi:glycerol-3-phosphate dehydrogenase subunit B